MRKIISILLVFALMVSININISADDAKETPAAEEPGMSVELIPAENTSGEETETSETVLTDEITENQDNSTDLYDLGEPEKDSWKEAAAMKERRADCDIITNDGVLYAVGGMNETGYLSTIERYDETADIWETVTEIPDGRKGFAVAYTSGFIYIIGGYENGSYLNSFKIYDIDMDMWTDGADMQESRDQAAAMYMDGKIYVFGGRDINGFVNSYEFYDSNSKKWNRVTGRFADSMIRVGANVKYINGYVCMYGGIDENYSYCGVDLYSVDDLENEQNFIEGGSECISIAWGEEKALVFKSKADSNSYDIYEMLISDDIFVTDIELASGNSAGKFSQYAICNGYLYCIGGYNLSSKTYIDKVYKYSVYYGDYTAGDGIIESVVTEDGNSITLNAEAGREYMLFINAQNFYKFDEYTFTIEYVEDSFTVEDGCAFTAKKDKWLGGIQGTDLEITEMESNGISFICTEELSGEETITKTVNAVILKANSSGQRTITYSLTKQ